MKKTLYGACFSLIVISMGSLTHTAESEMSAACDEFAKSCEDKCENSNQNFFYCYRECIDEVGCGK